MFILRLIISYCRAGVVFVLVAVIPVVHYRGITDSFRACISIQINIAHAGNIAALIQSNVIILQDIILQLRLAQTKRCFVVCLGINIELQLAGCTINIAACIQINIVHAVKRSIAIYSNAVITYSFIGYITGCTANCSALSISNTNNVNCHVINRSQSNILVGLGCLQLSTGAYSNAVICFNFVININPGKCTCAGSFNVATNIYVSISFSLIILCTGCRNLGAAKINGSLLVNFVIQNGTLYINTAVTAAFHSIFLAVANSYCIIRINSQVVCTGKG